MVMLAPLFPCGGGGSLEPGSAKTGAAVRARTVVKTAIRRDFVIGLFSFGVVRRSPRLPLKWDCKIHKDSHTWLAEQVTKVAKFTHGYNYLKPQRKRYLSWDSRLLSRTKCDENELRTSHKKERLREEDSSLSRYFSALTLAPGQGADQSRARLQCPVRFAPFTRRGSSSQAPSAARLCSRTHARIPAC